LIIRINITSNVVQCLLTDIADTTVVDIPYCYNDVVDNYHDYVMVSNLKSIKTEDQCKLCFKFTNYLEDSGYFPVYTNTIFWYMVWYVCNYLTETNNKNVTHMSDDIKYEIYLHCPIDFIYQNIILTMFHSWTNGTKHCQYNVVINVIFQQYIYIYIYTI